MASNNDPCNDSLRYMYTAYSGRDSVLAVVDTASILVKKDYRKLSSAMDHLQTSYTSSELKRIPSTLRVKQ